MILRSALPSEHVSISDKCKSVMGVLACNKFTTPGVLFHQIHLLAVLGFTSYIISGYQSWDDSLFHKFMLQVLTHKNRCLLPHRVISEASFTFVSTRVDHAGPDIPRCFHVR